MEICVCLRKHKCISHLFFWKKIQVFSGLTPLSHAQAVLRLPLLDAAGTPQLEAGCKQLLGPAGCK